jgi:hypothetical protein
MSVLYTDLAPNTSWQSAEYILTPHHNGWAKGIIPYRLWAKQNIKRLYPLPDHVRDGLGYRTLWMRATWYPRGYGGQLLYIQRPAQSSTGSERKWPGRNGSLGLV